MVQRFTQHQCWVYVLDEMLDRLDQVLYGTYGMFHEMLVLFWGDDFPVISNTDDKRPLNKTRKF